MTCWLVQAYDELLEGWDSTEGESYSERFHVGLLLVVTCGDHEESAALIRGVFPVPQVIHTFLVSFNEQRRPIMPLLTAMRRTQTLSEEQRALREAWDALTEKVGETSEQRRCPACFVATSPSTRPLYSLCVIVSAFSSSSM